MKLTSIGLLATGAGLEPASPGDVVTLIDLRHNGSLDLETVSAAAHVARRSHRILVGVGSPPVGVDMLVEALAFTVHDCDHEGAGAVRVESLSDALVELEAAVELNSIASATCIGLLRMAEPLDVRAALIAESLGYSTLHAGPEYRRWLAAANFKARLEAGPPVLMARESNSLSIELNRPDRHNALNAAMRDALIEALDVALVDDSVSDVRITGRGPSFSSGGDLAEFGTASDPATAHLIRTQYRPGELIDRLGTRCSVHVHGAVMGGGLELAAFAASVVADPTAEFRLPEISMGLIPGAGGTVSVSRRIGRWRAGWMMLSGRSIDASTALRWGLIDAVQTRTPSM